MAVDVGCATTLDAAGLDAFFRQRVGPVLGWDYQHVYPLGGDRYLWLFQDAFIDHSGRATSLNGVGFAQNAAMLQTGRCFTLLHRGTTAQPSSFEPGAGEQVLKRWWWPLGGEVDGNRLRVFWAEMVADPTPPAPGDGLPWHPVATWLATYDATTLTRLDFPRWHRAPVRNRSTATPWPLTPTSATCSATPTSRTWPAKEASGTDRTRPRRCGWPGCRGRSSTSARSTGRAPAGRRRTVNAEPILSRYWAENPMQPRFLDGLWVAVDEGERLLGQ